MKRPKFVYFDLDDTLLDHRSAEKKALIDLQQIFPDAFGGIETRVFQDVYHERNVVLWHEYSEGQISRTDLQRDRFVHLLDSFSVNSLSPEKIGARYLEAYRDHWEYCDGALEGFEAIAEVFPVGVLTNGFAETQHAKLRRFQEIKDRLSACVISEEVGYMKPHPRLFGHATKEAGVDAEEILYIGDSLHSDVEGSQRAGWDVIWYKPDAVEVPEGVKYASSWAEAINLLSDQLT